MKVAKDPIKKYFDLHAYDQNYLFTVTAAVIEVVYATAAVSGHAIPRPTRALHLLPSVRVCPALQEHELPFPEH